MKIFIGSVRTTFAELEEFFTTEELEDFEDFLDELEELFDFVELEELLISSAELEEDFFLTLDELLPFSKLELVSAISSELEVVSGSIRMTLEESSPQATKKSNEQTGSNW